MGTTTWSRRAEQARVPEDRTIRPMRKTRGITRGSQVRGESGPRTTSLSRDSPRDRPKPRTRRMALRWLMRLAATFFVSRREDESRRKRRKTRRKSPTRGGRKTMFHTKNRSKRIPISNKLNKVPLLKRKSNSCLRDMRQEVYKAIRISKLQSCLSV